MIIFLFIINNCLFHVIILYVGLCPQVVAKLKEKDPPIEWTLEPDNR